MSNIIFLNPSWENLALIKAFIRLNYFVIGMGPASPFLDSPTHYRHIYSDLLDYSQIADVALLYSATCIASDNCDYSLLTSELISDSLKLPCFGLSSARLSNNKLRQRQLGFAAGILQPQYFKVDCFSDVISVLRNSNVDLMLKPIDSRGSMGITYLVPTSSLLEIQNAYIKALSASPSNTVLLEQFIDGKLFTLDGFAQHNELRLLGIAERERIGQGQQVTTKISYSSSHSQHFIDQCFVFLSSVVTAFGYSNGHVHCEALLNSDGHFVLLECTNRGGGVFTSSTINPYISGYDVNREFVSLKTQTTFSISPEFINSPSTFSQKDACLVFPTIGEPGQVLHTFDYSSIVKHPSVLAVKLFHKVGRPLPEPIDGPSRHCALVLKTSSNTSIKDIIGTVFDNSVHAS
tara:strand:- start:10441 stop:11658 length:1218 start_codon:yes stop_codon:yes gene_type:complete